MAEGKQKRADLSLQEKQRILERYDKLPKMSQRSAAVRLKISQPLLCKILKNRSNIEISALSNENMNRKRERSGKDGQVESALKIWFSNIREKNVPVNGPILRRKAEELAKTMGKDDFVATDGWFHRWKKRENIVYKHLHGEEKRDSHLVAANQWTKTEWQKIIAEYSPQDIYNADETELDFRAMPEYTYLFKSEITKGLTAPEERVTVLCCVNMIGEKRDLLVIGKSKNPRCFKDVKSLPVDYVSNANASMTNAIFSNWLIKWDRKLKRKIVLLVDNCTAHINNLSLKNIKMVFLPLNSTLLIQPCDQGITRTLKAHYLRQISAEILTEFNEIQDQPNASAIAKKISLLDALHFLAMSWRLISEKTIDNCFRKSGFFKLNIEMPISKEPDVTVDICERFPDCTSRNEFENCINIVSNSEVAATIVASKISNDNFKLLEENEPNLYTKEEILEVLPTNAQMQRALRILRRGVQYRAINFEKHYDYENYIQEVLNGGKQKTKFP